MLKMLGEYCRLKKSKATKWREKANNENASRRDAARKARPNWYCITDTQHGCVAYCVQLG